MTVSVLVWIIGFSVALIPLSQQDWNFYSQSGMCIPLPVTGKQFPGQVYSFSVMIVANFVMFLLIALGQVCSHCCLSFFNFL